MTSEAQTNTSDVLHEAFCKFDDDYLADVLRPWDCYEQDWYDNKTVLYRFESDDLLAREMPSGLLYEIGPIDTDAFDMRLVVESKPESASDTCVCWRHAAGYENLIGTKSIGMVLRG
ncbi:hypothetical protein [Raoultibacter massiliensis]|uniref:Uncharacterized protein n=1 Tax=Raoultibacter massiliensis TaxID=1852371 RepID=A0ABV1JEC6_9ACTN